jgi:glycosyltransferase involved in cell wall biosynthesis
MEEEETELQSTSPVKIPPPTVLQVLPALLTGGVERGAVDIAGAIVDGGGRAIVASAGGPMTHELTRLGAEHVKLPVDSKNPFIMWRNIRCLVDLVEAEKIDIIHARSRAPAWSSWFASRRTNKPFVTTFHGTYGNKNQIKYYYNSIMTKGEVVIAISGFIAGHIHQNYGVPTARITVIPRGIDLGKFDLTRISKERVVNQAKKWRLPDGVPVIMMPGRLTRWKGHLILIDAIKELGHKNFQCLIVGSDQGRKNYRRELENVINQYGLADVIHMIDHCEDMPAAYVLSDIVISASIEPEAFGRVVAEAQSLGRLVIAANHGGARETVVDGETGWLTPPGDAKALASTINRVLVQTAKERQVFSEQAIQHIQNKYSKSNMCNKTLEVYNTLLGPKFSKLSSPS